MNNHLYARENRRYPPWRATRYQRVRQRAAAPTAAYCVWVNGDLIPYDEASAHLLQPATPEDPAVFEEIRCYYTEQGPAIFRLRDHLERFLDTVHERGVRDLRYNLQDLQQAVNVAIHANNFRACSIRPVLFDSGDEVLLAVVAWECPPLFGPEKYETGIRVTLSSAGKPHEQTGGQYGDVILARAAARHAGFDEAILLDAEGNVAGCTAENLFVVRDGTIFTPAANGESDRISHNTIVNLARDLGYRVVEERLSPEQLATAAEIFVGGTAAEVIPVREIDYEPVGPGTPGPVTRALQALYFDTVRGRGGQEHGWLEYVMMEPLY